MANPTYKKSTQKRKEQEKAAALDMVERYNAGRKPRYTDGLKVAAILATYITAQKEMGKPITVGGMAISLQVDHQTWDRMKNGQNDKHATPHTEEEYTEARNALPESARKTYDYLTADREDIASLYSLGNSTEDTDTNGSTDTDIKSILLISDCIQKAYCIQSEERESRLYTRGSVADIFALKAQDGWTDGGQPQAVNQTLVLNGDSAIQALRLLGYSRSDKDI